MFLEVIAFLMAGAFGSNVAPVVGCPASPSGQCPTQKAFHGRARGPSTGGQCRGAVISFAGASSCCFPSSLSSQPGYSALRPWPLLSS